MIDLLAIEDAEKAAMRLVTRAIFNFKSQAKDIFFQETDLPQDVAEDCTSEALHMLNSSAMGYRLFGKIDYKKAIWLFFPEKEQAVALFVDSKAEKSDDARTATIQLSQTSMRVRMVRQNHATDEQGQLLLTIASPDGEMIVVTIFVKYTYCERHRSETGYDLDKITVFCLPSGALQEKYNPDARFHFWAAGRNAPTRGEEFRVRVKLKKLQEMAEWRVITIPVHST